MKFQIVNKLKIASVIGFFITTSVQAQPVSIAGIYPGKTTIEELKDMVELDVVFTKKLAEGSNYTKIKALNGKSAKIEILNGIVYQIDTSIIFDNEFIEVLVSKYGKPSKKVGEIKNVICQNKLGAKFERIEGTMNELWVPKNGVQALIRWRAGECDTRAFPSYILFDIKTVNDIEKKAKDIEEKVKGEKVNAVKDLL